MIVYKLSPIDDWSGWQKPSDIYRASVFEHEPEWLDPAAWITDWATAKKLARKIGWEGDISQGPYVTVLPRAFSPSWVVIAWKQANDGTTFIATPVDLPWLKGDTFGRTEG